MPYSGGESDVRRRPGVSGGEVVTPAEGRPIVEQRGLSPRVCGCRDADETGVCSLSGVCYDVLNSSRRWSCFRFCSFRPRGPPVARCCTRADPAPLLPGIEVLSGCARGIRALSCVRSPPGGNGTQLRIAGREHHAGRLPGAGDVSRGRPRWWNLSSSRPRRFHHAAADSSSLG